jgi:exonuclease SbcC
MIKSLEIKNIQSHKDSRLELSPGINALIGSSNNGKSAILRALNWAVNNRPLGIEVLLSNWAYDSKGKQNEEMSVTVEKGNSTLIRRKTKSENEYVIDGEVLEAIKTDVPDEVRKFFMLSETNMQKQQDAPFLLSLSSGKIAEYFNRIVRLDIIDRVLSNAESSRRKMKNQLESSESQEKKLKKELEKFEWIDSVEKLIEKIKVLDSKSEELSETKDDLGESVGKFEEASKEKYPDFKKEFKLISQIDEINEENKEMSKHLEDLDSQIEEFEEVSKKSFDFSKEKKIIDAIENTNLDRSEIEKLEEDIERFEASDKRIKGCTENIKELTKRLPSICPLCGAKMKDGKCVEEN